jgi:hypothetical protein
MGSKTVNSKPSSLLLGIERVWRYVVPTPTGPGDVFVVSSIASFHVGTFSKSARNAKTASAGLSIVTVFSNVPMVASYISS